MRACLTLDVIPPLSPLSVHHTVLLTRISTIPCHSQQVCPVSSNRRWTTSCILTRTHVATFHSLITMLSPSNLLLVPAVFAALVGAAAIPRDVTLDPTATAEAQVRDNTATRAFSAAQITAPNGNCLFIDPNSGDFRENLIPVQTQPCNGSAAEQVSPYPLLLHVHLSDYMVVGHHHRRCTQQRAWIRSRSQHPH